MSANEETFASDPDSENSVAAGWMSQTLLSAADCGIAALTLALKIFCFAILPFTSLCLTLGLSFLDCLPNDKLVPIAQGKSLISVTSNIYGAIDFQFLSMELKQIIRCTSVMNSRFLQQEKPLTRKSFLLRKIQWNDTVGDHGLGTLSSITLSVPLLGGTGGSGEAESSRPNRGKAQNFYMAVEDGAAEPEPKQKKRKRGRRKQKNQEGEVSGSSDGGSYHGSEDEENETTSDEDDDEMVVDGAEPAETLQAKTNPKASKMRSKDSGKGKGKEKAPARKPATKRSRRTGCESSPIVIDVDQSEDETRMRTVVPKVKKKKAKPKTSPIWQFFHEVEDVEDADPDLEYPTGIILALKNFIKNNFPQHWNMFQVWDDADPPTPTAEEWEWAPTEPSVKSLYMFIDGVTPPNAETETPRTLTGSVPQIQLEVMCRAPRNSSGFETVKMEFLKSQNLKTSLILSGCRSAEVTKRRWRGYSVRAAESLIRYVTCVTFRDIPRQNHRRDDFWRAVCVSGQGISLPEVEMSKSR
ncbi:hypothetical protein C8R45DRAFT_937310 [Mycena sanguinolenta]|nr:hypothetical protein C8R45DRAFT_937310 [Mycena sanguinolenta]